MNVSQLTLILFIGWVSGIDDDLLFPGGDVPLEFFPDPELPSEIRERGNPGCLLVYSPQDHNATYLSVFGDSCTRVPQQNNNLTSLSFKNTRITELNKDDFLNWSSITSLSIEMNEELRIIQPGAFDPLVNLKSLSLNSNYKLVIGQNIFKGLVSLEELKIVKSCVPSLKIIASTLSPSCLPNLKSLDLSDNALQRITSGDFEPMKGTKVEKLFLNYCGILHIDEDALSPFGNLTTLHLERNNLDMETATRLVKSLKVTSPHLQDVNLNSNLIHENPSRLLVGIGQSNISVLDIGDTHFDKLVPGIFPLMPHLTRLGLSGVMATDIAEGTISSVNMPNLKSLVLSRNRLPGISAGVLIPSLQQLDLSDNSGESQTSVFKIGEGQFRNMTSLRVLNLSKNSIFHIKLNTFLGLNNLRVLRLSNCSIYKIDNNIFNNTKKLEYLSLERNNIRIQMNTFTGLGQLKALNMDYCSLTNFSEDVFTELKSLEFLSLKENFLVELSSNIFAPLTSLIGLDLSRNNLLDWSDRYFTENVKLQYLFLASNQITTLELSMLEDFNLTFLNLNDNPFECNCQLVLNVKNYCKGNNLGLDKLSIRDSSNFCFSPRASSNVTLINFIGRGLAHRDCDSDNVITFCIYFGTVAVLLSFSALLIYYLRWHIKYWIILLKQYKGSNHFPGRSKKTPSDERYKYDAFISYSNEDRNFVVQMASMLEKQPPFLSLCVFERDFNAGDVISARVINSVEASRRIVLVLSDAYARSRWCQWEMYIAEHFKGIFSNDDSCRDPLVLIKLGNIEEAHMTMTLKYNSFGKLNNTEFLMKTRVYLEWNRDLKKQKLFWAKLRESLSAGRGSEAKEATLHV